MYVEQIYTNCLAEASYYIESDGEVAIIDPIRETEPYTELAAARGAKIKYVFETHFHADFVSGHIDLAKKAGAPIVFGPQAETKYDIYNAKDGETFNLGKVRITALHTPGHTPESTSYLLKNENGEDHAVFTGDTLFVGDVGRPDLLDGKMSKEALAGMMYDSLNNKIKPLADKVIVFPGHGPGSACGKNIGKETQSTIGDQKSSNYALQEMSREEFISQITNGLSAPPPYFFHDAKINKEGYENIDEVIKRNTKPLTIADFKAATESGSLILDTRHPDVFEKAFIPGSVNIGLNGSYAVWVGTVIPANTSIVVVAEQGKEREAVLRLSRVGYENVKGVLNFKTWETSDEKTDSVRSVNPKDFEQIHTNNHEVKVLDVRKKGEFETKHIKEAQHLCLSKLPSSYSEVEKEETVYIHCAGGYRSMIASSLLQREGFRNIVNIRKGFKEIKETTIPLISEEEVSY